MAKLLILQCRRKGCEERIIVGSVFCAKHDRDPYYIPSSEEISARVRAGWDDEEHYGDGEDGWFDDEYG